MGAVTGDLLVPGRRTRLAAAAVAILLFAVNCYRAMTQSVVHDEALTWSWYVAGPVSAIFHDYQANHHLLSTLLIRGSVALRIRGPFWSDSRASTLPGPRPCA